jgi:hypothetical protein
MDIGLMYALIVNLPQPKHFRASLTFCVHGFTVENPLRFHRLGWHKFGFFGILNLEIKAPFFWSIPYVYCFCISTFSLIQTYATVAYHTLVICELVVK